LIAGAFWGEYGGKPGFNAPVAASLGSRSNLSVSDSETRRPSGVGG
jgi:hypothetical protein